MTAGGPRGEPPVLAGYRSVGFVARGGRADVFRYREDRLGRDVAVKVLVDPAARGRFLAEGSIAARMGGLSSGAVSVHRAGEAADGRPYLVLEYCPGGGLDHGAPIGLSQVVDLGVRICDAVAAVHRAGFLHRDLRPANVLLAGDGRPRLTGFRLAARPGAPRRPEAFPPAWSAPELVFDTAGASAASEVYSLAATVYGLLTGHAPYVVPGGDNRPAALERRLGAGLGGLPRVAPVGLNRLLRTALDPDPRARPGVVQFARRLAEVGSVSSGPPTAASSTVPFPVNPATGRARLRDEPAGRRDPERRTDAWPHGGSTAGPIPGRGSGQPAGGRIRTLREPDPTTAGPPPVAPRPSALRRLALWGTAVLGLTAATWLGFAVAHGGTEASTPKTQILLVPRVPTGAVAAPAVRAERRADGSVRFTWEYPDGTDADYFRVSRTDGGGPAEARTVRTREFVLPAEPGVRPCVEVTVFRADGRGSATPGRACAP